MKRIIFTITCLLCSTIVFSQESFFHLSFVPPLSTHGAQASKYTNSFSFNILAGISQNEKGFTMGGLTNIILNDADGFQMAGINNLVGGSGSGFMMGGVVNTVGGDYRGFQMGGVANMTRDNFNGMQMGGVWNSAGTMRGMQWGGVANIAKDVSGFQFAGLFNVARNVRGVQMAGLLNIAENSDYPIGLLNIIKNGEKSIGVSYNEIGSMTLSFRSGGRVLYGILGAGFNHRAKDDQYVLEGGLGAHINISDRFRINNEIKASYLTSFKNSKNVSHNSFSIMPAFKILPMLEVYAGPSINYMDGNDMKESKVFPNHSIWKKYTDKKMKQLYVGYNVGTHFLF